MARKVNHINTKCCICESSESYVKYIDSNTKKPVYLWYREYDKNYNGDFTGRYLCNKCWNKESPNSFDNIQKSLRDRRTNNLKNSYSAEGDKYQLLACIQFGWEDLNKKYDNYNTPVDCHDPKTGLFHQVRGRIPYYNIWNLTHLEPEWNKKFETMVIYCASKDGKRIERIYIFPYKEIKNRRNIGIYENPLWGGWYEKYRVKDNNVLIEANKIWKEIIGDL